MSSVSVIWALVISIGVSQSVQPRNIAAQPVGGRVRAMLIGVERYAAAPALSFAADDAQMLARTLMEAGTVQADDIVVVSDDSKFRPDRATLGKLIPGWLAKAGLEDTVILFFSGHGFRDASGRMYLAPSDCRLDDLVGTAIAVGELRELLGQCRARTKILILDACHSGSIKGTALDGWRLAKQFEQLPGVVTLASCRGQEVSLEWPQKRQGVFSYWLVRGLGGEADVVADRKIDIDELYRYVSDRVRRTAVERFGMPQTPVRAIGPEVVGIPVVIRLRGGPERTEPPPISRLPLRLDLQKTQEGALPQGWSGDASVAVRRQGSFAWLQAAAKGMHFIQSPPLQVVGDFELELRLLLPLSSSVQLVLEGGGGTPDLSLSFRSYGRLWSVAATGASDSEVPVWLDRINRVRLLRAGEVYRVIVNDRTIVAHRLPQHRQFGRVKIGLSGPARYWKAARVMEFVIRRPGTGSRAGKGRSTDGRREDSTMVRPVLGLRLASAASFGILSKPAGIRVIGTLPEWKGPPIPYGAIVTHVDGQRVRAPWQLYEMLDRAGPRGWAVLRFHAPWSATRRLPPRGVAFEVRVSWQTPGATER